MIRIIIHLKSIHLLALVFDFGPLLENRELKFKNLEKGRWKTMVIILVLLTIFVAFFVERMVSNRPKKRAALARERRSSERFLAPAGAIPATGRAIQFPEDLYYHQGHAWVRLEGEDAVRVGLDDFTQQVMGKIDNIEVPSIGSELNRGKVAWKVRHDDRKLNQLAPVGGTVVAVNEEILKDGSLANTSPYDKGWIIKIKPKAFDEQIPALMDSFQFRIHFDKLMAKLRSSFHSPSLGIVYGDGGEVVTGAGWVLDEKFWKILVTQIFHTSPE